MPAGAWVSNYAPLYPGSHPQRGRIVRALYRAPGMGPSADRLTTLEGLGTLGDGEGDTGVFLDDGTPSSSSSSGDSGGFIDTSGNGGGGSTPADTGLFLNASPAASQPPTSDSNPAYAKLVGDILSNGLKATPAAIAAYQAASGGSFNTNTLNQILAAATGRAAAVQQGTASMPSGSSMAIGIGLAALAAALLLVLTRKG